VTDCFNHLTNYLLRGGKNRKSCDIIHSVSLESCTRAVAVSDQQNHRDSSEQTTNDDIHSGGKCCRIMSPQQQNTQHSHNSLSPSSLRRSRVV